ncbi:LacI family DNA-binding transcriptional regulator [Ruania sp. N2-46]|uniref:LacI family DNA-binding transcriptional regulator n=2 Tax=Occultella gossypii TaxID=2800820 RepID=A0ABS7SC18_9MICO|nr:LacI family DNA-binding transcriptional regulator [Occultella gossypii]
MRDVAALAGVSLKTVSRVVNSEPHIRPETVARVRDAIASLGWVPNGNARALRTGRTGVIGIAVAGLRRPYLAALVEALVSETDRRGLQAAVEPSHGDPERIRAVLDGRGPSYDGVVLIGDDGAGLPLDGALTDRPVVVVQGDDADADVVLDDVASAMGMVTRHLAVLGRRRPLLLGGDRGADRGPRTPGVLAEPGAVTRAALAAAGFEATVPVIRPDGEWDRGWGAAAAVDALAAHPETDVLICVNDEVALGALSALTARGVDVPGEVALLGYDNLDDGWFSTPSLTTVDAGPARLARAALDLLAERIAGTVPAVPRRVVLPVELVRRESTLGAPR